MGFPGRPGVPNEVPFHLWMIENGYTSREIAEKTGLTRGAIDKYRMGKRVPVKYVIRLLKRIYGIDESYFKKRIRSNK